MTSSRDYSKDIANYRKRKFRLNNPILPVKEQGVLWTSLFPSCIAFCYPKNGEPFVAKGMYESIYGILSKSEVPMVIHYEIYKRGSQSKQIEVVGTLPHHSIKLLSPTRTHPQTKQLIRHDRCWIYVTGETSNQVYLCKPIHRLPRGWIDDLNKYTRGTRVVRSSLDLAKIKGKNQKELHQHQKTVAMLSPMELALQEKERAEAAELDAAILASSIAMKKRLQAMGALL